MSWRQWMRERLFPWTRRGVDPRAASALRDAEQSHLRSTHDLDYARTLRQESEGVAAHLRRHNTANRYDDFLRKVVQGRD